MQYALSEIKKFADVEGNVVRVLVAISLIRDTGSESIHGYVLSQDELTAYLADEATLKDVAVTQAAILTRALGSEPAEPAAVQVLKEDNLPAITITTKDVEDRLEELKNIKLQADDQDGPADKIQA